jgi:hypothetical protein
VPPVPLVQFSEYGAQAEKQSGEINLSDISFLGTAALA